jgi:hypothetical protein
LGVKLIQDFTAGKIKGDAQIKELRTGCAESRKCLYRCRGAESEKGATSPMSDPRRKITVKKNALSGKEGTAHEA